MGKASILLVDDEAKVISSLSRTLFEEELGEIHTAQNAAEALEVLQKTPSLTLVISDYHMPGMNGIDLLAEIRAHAPDTSRILLTGAADLEMAIEAVNRGNVFRFLVKPCPSEVLVQAVKDGIRYNQLITSERELLNKTLNGSVKVMIDILSIQSPSIFAQASRLRRMAHELGAAAGLTEQLWEIDLAALLCQIGAVTIPGSIYKKWEMGMLLKENETEMIRTIPRMGRQLIMNIPRLENIAEGVGLQNCTYVRRPNDNSPSGESIPVIARILKIVMDYDRLQENTLGAVGALKSMITRHYDYDPYLLEVFRTNVLRIDEQYISSVGNARTGEKQINVDDLKPGMVLARDISDKNNVLIVSKDTVVSEVLMYKLVNFYRSKALIAPIFIESTF